MTLRVAFDVGGVLSKYPAEFRQLARLLVDAGVDVFVISDMSPKSLIVTTLKLNGFDFIDEARVLSADFATHGEGCKAVLLSAHAIDMFIDDHVGYVAAGGAPIRLLIMPDATKPYFADAWDTVNGSIDFGRQKWKQP